MIKSRNKNKRVTYFVRIGVALKSENSLAIVKTALSESPKTETTKSENSL